MYYDTAADEEAARKQLKTVTEKWSGQYSSLQALLKALYLGTFEQRVQEALKLSRQMTNE